MEKLGGRFGRGRGVATRRRRGRLRGELSFIIPREGVLAMTRVVVLLRHPRQRRRARRGPRRRSSARSPTSSLVAGDLVLNGPDPAGDRRPAARDGGRRRASIVQGNTDIAVADFDYAAAFPWMTDGVPETFRAAAEWAHDALGDERRRLAPAPAGRAPAARRRRHDVLVCHASPGSQTAGFDQALDPNVIIERVSRTDARVIACGHTHLPEVRDLGWKVIVNGGSAGYVFDGDPTASWALDRLWTTGDVTAEIRRTEFDTLAVANAISARGLPGDVYRAATVRTGKLVR